MLIFQFKADACQIHARTLENVLSSLKISSAPATLASMEKPVTVSWKLFFCLNFLERFSLAFRKCLNTSWL